MALAPWEEVKSQIGYDDLSDGDKLIAADNYANYVRQYYSEVEPTDPKEVDSAATGFIASEAQEVLGDLGMFERGSQFLKNIGRGTFDAASSTVKGLALAQQVIGEKLGSYNDDDPIAQRDLYEIGAQLDDIAKKTLGLEDPRLRGEILNEMFPKAIGNAIGFMAAGAAAAGGAAVLAPEAAAATVLGGGAMALTGGELAATAAVGGLGTVQQAYSGYEEAKQYGADEETARKAALLNAPLGTTEALPFASMGAKVAGRVFNGLTKGSLLGAIGKSELIKEAVKGLVEEAGQEGFQQLGSNVVAQNLYDPNRGTLQGVGTSMLVGGLTGFAFGAGVGAITRDNEAFYGQSLAEDIDQKRILAEAITDERRSQIVNAARNAFVTTKTKADLETGEESTEQVTKTVFGDRAGAEVPDIGSNPAINSVPISAVRRQEKDGTNVETITYHTPMGLMWEAEFRTGQPLVVRDVTDTSPLLDNITNPKDPKTATRSPFTGRIISPTSSLAAEFGLETEAEMDKRLIDEAQRNVLTGNSKNDREETPINQLETPRVPTRDDAGIARQAQLRSEIDRLYKLRDDYIAKQHLIGGNTEVGRVGDGSLNTAKTVIKYDSSGRVIDQTAQPSPFVSRVNRMIAVRENELAGLTARPESYIYASVRDRPPSESQKLALVQGFQRLWERITSPRLREAIQFEVGDIQPLIDTKAVPMGAVAYYRRASNGRKAMVFLSDKLATNATATREILHELGHAFYDTLPAGIQAKITELWRAETQSRSGALFDENGALLSEVSPRVMDSPQEFFSERLAWTNDNWAKGRSESSGVMQQTGNAFRSLLDRFMRYTGHGERLNLEFKAFLNQGDRFSGLRGRIADVARASVGTDDKQMMASARGLAGSEGYQPKRERIGTTGQYVGLPEGIDTPDKVNNLLDKLEGLAKEGEAGRFWYENSSEEILKVTGGNLKDAEMIVALIAAYSPQNRVYPNWGMAIRAYAQYKRGEEITIGKTARDVERAKRVVNGERWEGIKTNNFYHNLMIRIDPAQTIGGATVDMWIMRVFGYKTDTPSKTQYAAAENAIKKIAARIGWEPQQVQAAIWVAGKAKWEQEIWPKLKKSAQKKGDLIQVEDEKGKKKWEFKSKEIAEKYRTKAMKQVFDKMDVDISEAALDFRDMSRRNLATVSVETRFGTTTGESWQDLLSPEQLLEYHKQKERIFTSENGANIVLREFGVPMDNIYNAIGLWKGQANPLSQIEVPSYRDTGSKSFVTDKSIAANINDAIAAMGIFLRQDGMAWHQPFVDAKVGDSNGMEFKLGRQTTVEETVRLGEAFGDGYAIVNVRNGFRVLKFNDSIQNVAFHKDAIAKVEALFPDSDKIKVDRFGFDGNLIENDWSKNPNGENYRLRLKESGRSDLFGRLEDLLGSQIQRLDGHWRGIAESRGRTDGQSAGGTAQGIGQGTQVGGIQEGGSSKVGREAVQQAATAFREGQLSREQFNQTALQAKPLSQVTSVQNFTDEQAIEALDQGKREKYGAARSLPEGTPVGLRIDIPAFKRAGVYVVTIHNQAEGGRVGKVIGYDKIAAVKGAKFFVASQKVALSIAEGYSKTPLATVEGQFIPITEPPADIIGEYKQVGYDPERFSYFYSKENGNPITAADEAILAGNTVFVKGAVEGNRADFLYSTRGEQAFSAPVKVFNKYAEKGKDLRIPINTLVGLGDGSVSAIDSIKSAVAYYDMAVEGGKHTPREDEKLARIIAQSLIDVNPSSLTKEKTRINSSSGKWSNRAFRSSSGFVGYPRSGAEFTTVVHETIHSLTADKLNKFGWYKNPIQDREGIVDYRNKKGDLNKDIIAYMNWDGADPKVVRIIKLYKSTVEQLGVDKFYLGDFKTRVDRKPKYGIRISETDKSYEIKAVDYLPKSVGDGFREANWSESRVPPSITNRIDAFHNELVRTAGQGDVVYGRTMWSRGFRNMGVDKNEMTISKSRIPQGVDPIEYIKQKLGYPDKRMVDFGSGMTKVDLKNPENNVQFPNRKLLIIDDTSDFSSIKRNKSLMNNNPDITTRRGGDYGLGNLDEFLAAAFSDSGAQDQLKKLRGDSERKSLWQSLVEAIRSLLGITPDNNMLESIMDAAYDLANIRLPQPANIVDVSDQRANISEKSSQSESRAPPQLEASTRGEQIQRTLEPLITFGKNNLRTQGALPYDIFRMSEQRGFNINEKMLRAQNAIDDLDASVKRVLGRGLSKLTEDESKKINEALQNPLARARLAPDIAAAVGNARNLLDSLSAELIRSGAIPDRLVPVVQANMGVYLTRAYEKWENPKFENPFSKLPKEVQNKIESTVKGWMENKYAHAYAKEQSLARGEPAIDSKSPQYMQDFQTGIAKARNGGITKSEIRGYIDMLGAPEGESPFSQIGSGLTKDLSIVTARKDIPPEIRMLWGEIKDPRVNFLLSMQRMSNLLETHNMLKSIRDAGMNKIFFSTPREGFSTKLVSDGSRASNPLNMFVDGMSNDIYTSEEIAKAMQDTFGGRSRAQDALGKMAEWYLKANGITKFAKTVLSVQTQVRNLLGNAQFLVANGYIFSPDGAVAMNKLKSLVLPAAGAQLGLSMDKALRDYNAKLTRLGILGQGVFANEMQSYFKDANMNMATDFFDNYLMKSIKKVGNAAVGLYQMGDSIPKAIAFEVELARLRRAMPATPVSKLEMMAADKVLNLMPTYSRIPKLGNVLRSQPFVGAFISFPLEVFRTGYNLVGTINEELRSDNPEIRKTGAYRLTGAMLASIGFSAAAAGLAAAMGIDDDEDKAIRSLDAPWDKYATKLYLGRDGKGNVQQVNLSYVDPYNYLRDPLIALVRADGTWDQRLMEATKTAFEPFYGEQILAGKILDVARNKKGTTGGRVYNPEADVFDRSTAIAGHLFDAFNIGTIGSGIRVYKGLTGQVTQTGRAYDPALETIATVTGQRVVTLDPRQSLSFAARRFNNRINDATGIFTAAYYDRSNISQEARLQAYQDMMKARTAIFNDTSGIVNAAMRLGVSRSEIIQILRDQGVSRQSAQALVNGTVSPYVSAKKELKRDAIRYRLQGVSAGQ